MKLDFKPLTQETWSDLEMLFGEKGGCAGCWCMYWRLRSKEFESNSNSANKKLMKALVRGGTVPGIIGFERGNPAGWCAFAPRTDYVRLETSRILKPVDKREVWSITCFFVERTFRGKGVATEMLKAAVTACADNGAKIVEGYPVETAEGKRYPPAFAWYGVAKMFERAGFEEVARRSPSRPIMRITV